MCVVRSSARVGCCQHPLAPLFLTELRFWSGVHFLPVWASTRRCIPIGCAGLLWSVPSAGDWSGRRPVTQLWPIDGWGGPLEGFWKGFLASGRNARLPSVSEAHECGHSLMILEGGHPRDRADKRAERPERERPWLPDDATELTDLRAALPDTTAHYVRMLMSPIALATVSCYP